MSYMPESRPRSSMPFILHQADLLAARVEFEREWLPKFKNPVPSQEKNFTLGDKPRNAQNKQQKALGSIKSEGLKNLLDSI